MCVLCQWYVFACATGTGFNILTLATTSGFVLLTSCNNNVNNLVIYSLLRLFLTSLSNEQWWNSCLLHYRHFWDVLFVLLNLVRVCCCVYFVTFVSPDNTGQQRFCLMRKNVCFLCIFGRWIQICFQNFSITHTFRWVTVSQVMKMEAKLITIWIVIQHLQEPVLPMSHTADSRVPKWYRARFEPVKEAG